MNFIFFKVVKYEVNVRWEKNSVKNLPADILYPKKIKHPLEICGSLSQVEDKNLAVDL